MRLLLDTHAFLWFVSGDDRLSSEARCHIEHPEHDAYLSVASVWEMAIKISLGRLSLQGAIAEFVVHYTTECRMGILDISVRHAAAVASMPWCHRDPFDRLLAAQCSVDQLTLVTADTAFDAYGVPRIW